MKKPHRTDIHSTQVEGLPEFTGHEFTTESYRYYLKEMIKRIYPQAASNLPPNHPAVLDLVNKTQYLEIRKMLKEIAKRDKDILEFLRDMTAMYGTLERHYPKTYTIILNILTSQNR
ncbi:hypothetical protein [Helicobacter suis]|uniref:Uncharacterized protein n=2 Tax=Helicobacter suis TaxID=104628 RepID=A0A6J4CXN8_9HELI|nr:hypothetical protein [Helicobacter suis]BCD46911.1 hypothetical protein NHP194003_01150 [Helicobacter suis]BCD50447.1 hypothetical protein NHP194022_01180 [Helicobacter suis]BCD69473.1 hypothetical protein SNTW_01180 [Helicobacter suis]BDR27368.1 hypothetical protein HSHS1_01290 [Helicobacter suis HS1]